MTNSPILLATKGGLEFQEMSDENSIWLARKMIHSWEPISRALIHYLGDGELEIIRRVSCVVVRKKSEKGQLIRRMLLIPPFGFSGTNSSNLDPHPEARWAKAKLLGGMKLNRRGFSNPGRTLTIQYSLGRSSLNTDDNGGISFTPSECSAKIVAWKQWFFAYHENGVGFFHAFQSQSATWIAIVIEKQLVEGAYTDWQTVTDELAKIVDPRIVGLITRVQMQGSSVFESDPYTVAALLRIGTQIIIPCFLKMLNAPETGRHENCTFFALILKAAQADPNYALRAVLAARDMQQAPKYYLDELTVKLRRIADLSRRPTGIAR